MLLVIARSVGRSCCCLHTTYGSGLGLAGWRARAISATMLCIVTQVCVAHGQDVLLALDQTRECEKDGRANTYVYDDVHFAILIHGLSSLFINNHHV